MVSAHARPATTGPTSALADRVGHDVLTDRATDRYKLAHDASHYLLVPSGVATPRGVDEVAALLRSAGELGQPVTFRAGGTSLSGQAVTDEVLVDVRRHFRGIEPSSEGTTVTVGPGATVRQVNAHLARYGRVLGPDPASEIACTMGGVFANNSSGMKCGTEFNTYNTVVSAVLVLPSGTVVDTAAPDADERLRHAEPALHAGLLRLRDRVRGNPESVRRIASLFAIKNTMGYAVNALVDFDDPVEILLHLVVGSEGTLAFVARATFRTLPLAPHAATALLVLPHLGDATAVLPDLVATGPAAVELLDRTSLRVSQRDPAAASLLGGLEVDEHAALLVQYEHADADGLDRLVAEAEPVLERMPLQTGPTPAPGGAGTDLLSTDPATRATLWHLRKGLYATVADNRVPGSSALLEDVAVPVPALLDACAGLLELFDAHDYEDSVIFGHAKDGNVHFMLGERFDDPASLRRYEAFTEEMVDLVLGLDGTLKAEHGTGRIMAPFVRRQYGDELYAVMQEIKRLLDPRGVLAPGVLLSDDETIHLRHLKETPTVEEEVDRCVECGFCEPVCPSRDVTTTPRQRIVLRREMDAARHRGDDALVAELEEQYEYDAIDTCAADGMCATACPVGIDTGQLVKRLRAQEAKGAEQAGWAAAASAWGPVTRGAATALDVADRLPSPLVTGATDAARAVVGADRVPRYTGDLPAGGTARRGRDESDPDVVLFASCLTTMFAPAADDGAGSGPAFLRLAERAGLRVRVPEDIGSLCCGTPWSSKGMHDGAEAMATSVAWSLWEASDRGRLPVVCDAASCTEGLEHLVETAARLVPGLRVVDAIEYAAEEIVPRLSRGDASPGRVVVHPTCATHKAGTTPHLVTLAEAVGTDVVVPEDWGCCGFAGDRGMLHPELTAGATAPEAAQVVSDEADAHVSANRTCEMALSRATGRTYEHVLEVLERVTR